MQLFCRGAVIPALRGWFVAFAVIAMMTVIAPSDVFAEVAGSGNVSAGKALFTGETPFSNGGPACISCHTTAELGSLGGGTLGPNLTNVWQEKFFLIDAGWINGEGVPVMGPIFSTKNVTEDEVEDLKAYFSSVAAGTPVPSGSKFVAYGVIFSIVMLVFFSIVWGNRYRSRNKGTAHDALWRNYGGKGGR
jgi:mono/diheme cytochrome c family protein